MIAEWRPPDATISVAGDRGGLDDALAAAPDQPAVFLIWAAEGAPHLARTNVLRRRLRRLLGPRDKPSRMLHLRDVVQRVEYWLTASRLEASLLSYELGRRYFPDSYAKLLNLRMPSYVKLILTNVFPRTQVTTRLSASASLAYGPFRSRAAAEQFESQFLDLFQVRRCQEDLEPSPEHPGCVYGEMNMCLRPCQQVVSMEEYASEVKRVEEFLATGGAALVERISASRDRLSQDLEFEEAARQHKRLERVEAALKLRDDLASDVERLCGVAVARSAAAECVELFFVRGGVWLAPERFFLGVIEGKTLSLDQRLKELIARLPVRKASIRERQEHLALLARWYYSSWRDGEWLGFETLERVPYRKLVNAIHRVASAT